MKTLTRMEKKECSWELQETRWESQDEGKKEKEHAKDFILQENEKYQSRKIKTNT